MARQYTMAYDLSPTSYRLQDQTPYEGMLAYMLQAGHLCHNNIAGIVARGIYVDQLINYLCAGFQPESLLILTQGGLPSLHVRPALTNGTGELAQDPLATAQRIAAHVGVSGAVEREWPFANDVQRQSRTQGRVMPALVAAMLEELYAPHTHLLMKLLRSNKFNTNVSAIEQEFGWTSS